MQVKEIMSKQVISVKRSTTLRELLELFGNFHVFPLVPVIGEDKRLAGIVSFRNLIDAFQSYRPDVLKLVPFLDDEEPDIFKTDINEEMGDLVIAEDIMEHEYISIFENASLEEAYNLMKLHLKEEIPVVDMAGRLTGRIGIFDILREIFRSRGVIK